VLAYATSRDQPLQLGHVIPHFALQPLLALLSGFSYVIHRLLGSEWEKQQRSGKSTDAEFLRQQERGVR
jgi:hypothetical protein